MLIPWKEEYSVKVKEIDEQHQEFIKILSDVYNTVISKESKREILELFKELVDFAKIHFETEEKYFDQFHYPIIFSMNDFFLSSSICFSG